MAQKLYKWTGKLSMPTSYESTIVRPYFYGCNDDGVCYAYLDTAIANNCSSSENDFAATTASADKTWVKENSSAAKLLNKQCREEIRKSYSLEDELKAYRTDDSAVKKAIGDIVASYTTKKNALVGD